MPHTCATSATSNSRPAIAPAVSTEIASSGSRARRVRNTSRTPSGTGAPVVAIAELAFVLQEPDELGDEERVAGGAVVERIREVRVGVVADDRGHVVADLVDG